MLKCMILGLNEKTKTFLIRGEKYSELPYTIRQLRYAPGPGRTGWTHTVVRLGWT